MESPNHSAALADSTGQRVRAVERHPWFRDLPAALKEEILRRSTLRRCSARSLVYAAGSAPNGMFAVVSGEVRLEHLAKSGKFAFYRAQRPGDLFALLSEMDGSPRFSDARASVETTLLHLSHAQFQELYQTNAQARDAFVGLLCQSLHATLQMLVEEHSAPPRAQIAHILVSIFGDRIDGKTEPLKLTQEALAAMAGVSRQTTSKVLHGWCEQGLIAMQYGKVLPLDWNALEEIGRMHGAR